MSPRYAAIFAAACGYLAVYLAWPYILGVCQMIDAAIRQH